MAKTLGIAQVLELASKAKKREDKIAVLRNNFSSTLADVIKIALHPGVKFLLPAGTPPYAVCDVPDQEFMLFREIKKMYLFLDGGGNHLSQMQREKLFIDMLQRLAPKDAELVIDMKDKRLPYGIDYALVTEAFPGILPPLES